jgi:hypothetical protein
MTALRPENHVLRSSLTKIAVLWMLSTASSAPADDATRGAVAIESDFAGGNVKVSVNTEGQVHVEPDLRGDRPWFYWCFEATATRAGRVNFTFPEKVAGFTDGGIGFQGPAISTDRGKTWKWMGVDQVDGSSFWYDFAKVDECVRFAVTIPYLEQDFAAFLKANASNPHIETSVLTKSRNGREVELLRIGAPGSERKMVLVTGRHHAVETMASFVLEGFLAEAMSESPSGKAFRDKYVLFAVPFVDKDGVEEGDQGKNRQPHDHNRDYGEKSIYPEVQAIKQLDEEHDFQFALDFHCPTLVMRDHQVMYFVGAKTHPQFNSENVSEFAKWIKQGLPDAAPHGPLNWLRDEDSPSPMNSRYFGFKDNAVMAATFEFPFAPPGRKTDPESCRQYGRAMLRAWTATHFREPELQPATKPEKAPASKEQKSTQAAPASDDFSWVPPEANSRGPSPPAAEQGLLPEISITTTPKPTADASKYTHEFVIELEKFNISNKGTDAVETSKGLNAALQHAKKRNANRITFPQGVYLISATDPIVIDHQDTVIDLNGATLQMEPNAETRYSVVDIVDGAENVRLTNGTLRGDKDKHDFSSNNGSHEWGHCLIFHGGRNLEADHLRLTNATGDGANSRFSGARTRPELLAKIAHSVYKKHLEQGAFSAEGRKIDSTEKTRSIKPFDVSECGDEFEFGYSAGYLGYPFIRGRAYQAYFYDAGKNFLEMKKCLQFRKTPIPQAAKFLHLEFNQAEVPDEPFHAGAGRGSFVGRISNFKGPVDVHFHHNKLVGNRRLGLAYCGGRRWLIEDNLLAGNGGTAPGYGIDLEDGWEFMQDVVIRNNSFHDNLRGDLVICAGSELLIEGNSFENSVAVHARPHNYTFRNNKFQGGHVGYKTRTGVASIHGNTYENCTLSITFDSKGVADGINRQAGQAVATPPLRLVDETLVNVEQISGTYFDFSGATLNNAHFVAGEDTRLVEFHDCEVHESSIQYEAEGPPVAVRLHGDVAGLQQTGAGLNRRRMSREK